MRQIGWALSGAGLLASAAAAQMGGINAQGAASFQRSTTGWPRALFVCDGVDHDLAAVFAAPVADGRVPVTLYGKGTARAVKLVVRIGPGDPGAGQIHYPLSDARGAPLGVIHAVNLGAGDGATTPVVSSLTLGPRRIACRWAPQTRILGFTTRRSVMITGGTDGYRYQSFDFGAKLAPAPTGIGRATVASLAIDGGRLVDVRGGRRTYQFANNGFVYRVTASHDAASAGGGIVVTRGGRAVLHEDFAGYTVSAR